MSGAPITTFLDSIIVGILKARGLLRAADALVLDSRIPHEPLGLPRSTNADAVLRNLLHCAISSPIEVLHASPLNAPRPSLDVITEALLNQSMVPDGVVSGAAECIAAPQWVLEKGSVVANCEALQPTWHPWGPAEGGATSSGHKQLLTFPDLIYALTSRRAGLSASVADDSVARLADVLVTLLPGLVTPRLLLLCLLDRWKQQANGSATLASGGAFSKDPRSAKEAMKYFVLVFLLRWMKSAPFDFDASSVALVATLLEDAATLKSETVSPIVSELRYVMSMQQTPAPLDSHLVRPWTAVEWAPYMQQVVARLRAPRGRSSLLEEQPSSDLVVNFETVGPSSHGMSHGMAPGTATERLDWRYASTLADSSFAPMEAGPLALARRSDPAVSMLATSPPIHSTPRALWQSQRTVGSAAGSHRDQQSGGTAEKIHSVPHPLPSVSLMWGFEAQVVADELCVCHEALMRRIHPREWAVFLLAFGASQRSPLAPLSSKMLASVYLTDLKLPSLRPGMAIEILRARAQAIEAWIAADFSCGLNVDNVAMIVTRWVDVALHAAMSGDLLTAASVSRVLRSPLGLSVTEAFGSRVGALHTRLRIIRHVLYPRVATLATYLNFARTLQDKTLRRPERSLNPTAMLAAAADIPIIVVPCLDPFESTAVELSHFSLYTSNPTGSCSTAGPAPHAVIDWLQLRAMYYLTVTLRDMVLRVPPSAVESSEQCQRWIAWSLSIARQQLPSMRM